jgi:hypothetical protein
MVLFRNENVVSTIEILVIHISGLEETFQEHQKVYMIWDEHEKKVMFQNKIYKVSNRIPKGATLRTVYLRVGKIKRVEIISEIEIRERGKSLGDLLIGPLGAIVSGMSEISNKKNTIIKYFMVFNYDENKIITLELPLLPLNAFKILNALRAHLNTPT